MSYAIDVNILIYASDDESPFHHAAREFVNRAISEGEIVCFAWTTLMSYLRILTHPSVLKRPRSIGEALGNLASILARPNVRVLGESERFWEVFSEIALALQVRGNLVSDTHVAALLKEHGVDTIYTNDTDFRKFDFLKVRDPLRVER